MEANTAESRSCNNSHYHSNYERHVLRYYRLQFSGLPHFHLGNLNVFYSANMIVMALHSSPSVLFFLKIILSTDVSVNKIIDSLSPQLGSLYSPPFSLTINGVNCVSLIYTHVYLSLKKLVKLLFLINKIDCKIAITYKILVLI